MRPFIASIAGTVYFGVVINGLFHPLFTLADVVEFREAVVDCCNRYLEASSAVVPEVFEEAFNRHLVIKDLME